MNYTGYTEYQHNLMLDNESGCGILHGKLTCNTNGTVTLTLWVWQYAVGMEESTVVYAGDILTALAIETDITNWVMSHDRTTESINRLRWISPAIRLEVTF